MTDQKDSEPPANSEGKSPNPALMIGSIFAALVGMGWAVLTTKKNAGTASKPNDPAP